MCNKQSVSPIRSFTIFPSAISPISKSFSRYSSRGTVPRSQTSDHASQSQHNPDPHLFTLESFPQRSRYATAPCTLQQSQSSTLLSLPLAIFPTSFLHRKVVSATDVEGFCRYATKTGPSPTDHSLHSPFPRSPTRDQDRK
jgi:hypothetical protein